jgi:L-ascorbate metabolism protein UlaG (beta-lactamase superfamily)
MTDPVLGRRAGVLRRIVPPVPRDATERLDAILVSHLHGDHVNVPSLRRAAGSATILAPPHAAAWLRRRGFGNRVRAISPGDQVEVGGVAVEATTATHDGRRWPVGAPAAAIGFVIGRERAVYFAGDTDLFPGMAALAGRVDVALLPVWGWGRTLGPGHLDPERAAMAAAIIRPRVAIPIHWGTLAGPDRRPTAGVGANPASEFAAAAARLAPEVEVRVLEPGGRTALGEEGMRTPP